ncbi:MAG: hypothetical protein GWN79_00970, partial [Actinobacteria bacterium]|nr:hypothetical protein [Actinomycetota bacterium]NIS28737.1 hypothetical protein [Actinomycetota bacterium]NIT94120.1 hypothetical protein [Actinomycetota bacterium]NIU17748.1 hypothetical protein [Actinomycetota bacterium]NIU64199.1 hypothetical protein [Actinomycetota bacterium]
MTEARATTLARGFVAVVSCVALLAAACGGDDTAEVDDQPGPAGDDTTDTADGEGDDGADTDDSTTTTTTEAAVELTASWPGVTEDSIRVGFLEIDLETLVELELIDNNRGDPKVVIDALVDELNSRGGILGRNIEVFYEKVLPINTADAEAACLRLTEDEDVFVVLGSFVGPTVGVDPCITDLGETIMIGGNPTPDDLARAKAPWVSTSMALTRRLPAVIDLQHDAGVLVDPLAVVWAVEDENAAQELVLPRLAELGHDVAVEAVQLADAGDRRALAIEWQSFVERFRVDGVETVVLVLQSAGINGPSQLATLDYDGEIALVAASVLASIGITAQVPLEDLAGINGSMGPTADEAYDLPATQACVDILEAALPDVTVVPA